MLQFIKIKKILKFELKFILIFLFLISYSAILALLNNETSYLIRSLFQYICFAVNFITISIIFRQITNKKVSRLIQIFIGVCFINSLIQLIQILSIHYPNPIFTLLVNVNDFFGAQNFKYKPNGIFPEASLSAIFNISFTDFDFTVFV